MMIRRCLSYVFAAMAMCFGGLALAETGFGASTKYLSYQAVSAFETAGSYGHDVASFKAEQAHMVRHSGTEDAAVAGLLKDSHGFMQATADEVAKGTTGSTVSLYL